MLGVCLDVWLLLLGASECCQLETVERVDHTWSLFLTIHFPYSCHVCPVYHLVPSPLSSTFILIFEFSESSSIFHYNTIFFSIIKLKFLLSWSSFIDMFAWLCTLNSWQGASLALRDGFQQGTSFSDLDAVPGPVFTLMLES